MTNTKKAAPIWSRLSEQLTRCALCVCDPKHKHGDDSRYQAGGQCNQSGSVRCHTCNERFSLYSLRNCSRAKAHGANLSDSCSIFLRRLFRAGDNVLVNSLSVIVLSCIAMRRNTLHHGAGDGYSCSLALRRCSSSRAMAISCPSSSVALIPIFSTCANASREEIRGFSLLPSAWRRAISPRMAVTMNPALLSPSSFTDSMPSKASCGIRIEICFDLSLIVFFAMCILLNKRCDSVYTKKNHKKHLICDSVGFNLNHTSVRGCKRQRPELFAAVAGRLTKPLTGVTIMAGTQHTPRLAHTQTAFVWRFIALSTAQPRVITIEATSEQEARQQSPAGCVMVFAARIRQGSHHA
ncbi:TPA: host cell division inhibitor Icd-like protein [Escherichia coli]|nr:host cell division inhibitor Icd-like protein [Escherichia coli]EFX8664406.1 host cell division inhibitor Icd-like protein [Shigella sonnei]EFZ4870570.1 host cell division inhibitor Icd-like protein [Shigella dysenteriae]EFX9055941.1 host cell division inhibitor Icd-like protein [Shigella sonnei]EFX9430396.1 host cell division inhibitor Icd-like protein [Shigella sonnei]